MISQKLGDSLRSLLLGMTIISSSFANPVLTPGTWVNVGPSFVPFGSNPAVFTQGMAIDPTNPNILYLCAGAFNESNGGLFKTTDAGSTWRMIAQLDHPAYQGAGTRIDAPIRVRIDPNNPKHLYVGSGVRGTNGFFISNDGGEIFTLPESFDTWQRTIGTIDVYDVAVDPTDFNHLLLSFHSPWRSGNAGILESKDGGATWITHYPPSGSGWYAGMSVAFLFDPAKGIGDNQTWLVGVQGDGFWRTTNSGTSWTKVSTNDLQHGGGTIYYTKAGTLYGSGVSIMRSTDNGASWSTSGLPGGGYNCVFGDGNLLYTLKNYGPAPVITSPETNGTTWSNFNSQQFIQGAFEMAFDKTNNILYNASWQAGLWALKLSNYTGAVNQKPSPITENQQKAGIQRYVTKCDVLAIGPAAVGKSVKVYNVNGKLIQRTMADPAGVVRMNRDDIGTQTVIVTAR